MTKLKKYNSIDHFYSEELSHPSVGLIPSLDGQVVYTEPVVRVVIKMTSHQSGYREIFNFSSGTEICRIIVDDCIQDYDASGQQTSSDGPEHYSYGPLYVSFDLYQGYHVIELYFYSALDLCHHFCDGDVDVHSIDVYWLNNSLISDFGGSGISYLDGSKIKIHGGMSQIDCLHIPSGFSEFEFKGRISKSLLCEQLYEGENGVIKGDEASGANIKKIWVSMPNTVVFDPPVPLSITGLTEEETNGNIDLSVGGLGQVYKAGYIESEWEVPEDVVGVESLILPGNPSRWSSPVYDYVYKIEVDGNIVAERSIYDNTMLISDDNKLYYTFDSSGIHNIKFYLSSKPENPYVDIVGFFNGAGWNGCTLKKIDLTHIDSYALIGGIACTSSTEILDATGLDFPYYSSVIDALYECPNLHTVIYTGHYSQMYGEGGFAGWGWSTGDALRPGIMYYNGRHSVFLDGSMRDSPSNGMWLPVHDMRGWFPDYDDIKIRKWYRGFIGNFWGLQTYFDSDWVSNKIQNITDNEFDGGYFDYPDSEYFLIIDGSKEVFTRFEFRYGCELIMSNNNYEFVIYDDGFMFINKK